MNEMELQRQSCDHDSEDPNQPGGCRKLPEQRAPGLNLSSHSMLMGVLLHSFYFSSQEIKASEVQPATRGWK